MLQDRLENYAEEQQEKLKEKDDEMDFVREQAKKQVIYQVNFMLKQQRENQQTFLDQVRLQDLSLNWQIDSKLQSEKKSVACSGYHTERNFVDDSNKENCMNRKGLQNRQRNTSTIKKRQVTFKERFDIADGSTVKGQLKFYKDTNCLIKSEMPLQEQNSKSSPFKLTLYISRSL